MLGAMCGGKGLSTEVAADRPRLIAHYISVLENQISIKFNVLNVVTRLV